MEENITKKITQSRKDAKGKIIYDFLIFAYFLNSTILIQLIKNTKMLILC